MWDYLIYAIAGAIGGIVKDIVEDGGVIILPTINEGKLRLGSITSLFTGLVAGIIVDHHFLTAFLAGYAGVHGVEKIIDKAKGIKNGGGWLPASLQRIVNGN